MGQQQAKDSPQIFLKHFNNKFIVERALPNSNAQILKSKSDNNAVFLLRQLSMTSTDDFNTIVQKIKKRKDLKFEHYLSIEQFYTKSQNSFCSTFHRISLIYQYSIHNLQNEIEARLNEDRKFQEKQIWSILCSCSLALAFLMRNNIQYFIIGPQQIYLTSQGVIKLADPQISNNNMNGLVVMRTDQYYSPEYLKNNLMKTGDKGCIFSLGMCMLQVMLLQSMSSCYCYQQFRLNQHQLELKIKKIKQFGYSDALIYVVQKMVSIKLSQRFGVLNLEEYLHKLVHDAQTQQEVRKPPGIIQQKQIDEAQLSKEIITNEICNIQPQKEELSAEICMQFQQDNQNPDESDENQQQILTQRSNNLMLTQNFSKFIESKTNQSEINNIAKQKFKSNQYSVQKEPLKSKRQPNQTPNKFAEKISTPKLCTPQISHQNVKSQTLFTDPKIMAMLKKDLQIINLKRSKIQNSQIDSNRLSFSRNQIQKQQKNQKLKQYKKSYTKQPLEQLIIDQIKQSRLTSQANQQNQNQQNLENSIKERNKQNYDMKNAFSKKKNQPQIEGLKFVNEIFSKGKYEGQKLGNFRHGFGTFYYKEGGKYAGYWYENKMHGKGTLYYSNNKIAYQGQWKQDRLWGYGVLYNQQPKNLIGTYNYNSWNEIDEYWVKYQGNFQQDNKSGKGKLYLSNGQIFQGMFMEDQVNGQGIFYKQNRQIIRGIWKENILIKKF